MGDFLYCIVRGRECYTLLVHGLVTGTEDFSDSFLITGTSHQLGCFLDQRVLSGYLKHPVQGAC